MKKNSSSTEKDENIFIGRRGFLSGMAVTGLSISLLGVSGITNAEQTKAIDPTETGSGHDYQMPLPDAQNEEEFRMGVIGPATLSLITSEIAVIKATNKQAKEFANFELLEAIAVTTVLKQLNTPVPPMDAAATATLNKIKSAAKGQAFDKIYITAQLKNHEFLRDLANVYLKNSKGQTSVAEMHGQHLATLALPTFKEHVVHTKNILMMLG